jgi:hypothetical protein
MKLHLINTTRLLRLKQIELILFLIYNGVSGLEIILIFLLKLRNPLSKDILNYFYLLRQKALHIFKF